MSWDAIFLPFLQMSSDSNPARISWGTLSSRSSEIDFIHISKITMNCRSKAYVRQTQIKDCKGFMFMQ